MTLSNEIISKFAKAINNDKNKETSKTLDGTYVKIGNQEYVRLDGSEILTPVKNTVSADDGERVKVLLDKHTATIVNNTTSPSASGKVVAQLAGTVDAQGNSINRLDTVVSQQATSINQMNTHITQVDTIVNQHNVKLNQHDVKIEQQNVDIRMINSSISSMNDVITSQGNTINAQGNTIDLMNSRIISQGSDISSINDRVISQGNTIVAQSNAIAAQGNTIVAQGNTITAQGSNIQILNSGFVIENGELKGLSKISVDSLETEYLKTTFANIDEAHVDKLSVRKMYAQSGIMQYADISQLQVPGELIGTVVNGDLILANTIKANKILLKNSNDGLFYALNAEGVPEGAIDPVSGEPIPQTNQNSLLGTILVAKSVTASKISVDDLVAFEATIGGFDITNNVISTPTKHYGIGADHVSTEFADKFSLLSIEPTDWNEKYNKYYKIVDGYYDHLSSLETFDVNTYYKIKDIEEDSMIEEAQGVYLNNDGQFMMGAQSQSHVKLYKTPVEGQQDDIWALDIKINDMTIFSDGEEITVTNLIKKQISEINDQLSNDSYILLDSEPSDWTTNFNNYYIKDNDGNYQKITGDTAPTFVVDTYYKIIPSINTRLNDMENELDPNTINQKIDSAIDNVDLTTKGYVNTANMDAAFESFKANNIRDYSAYLTYNKGNTNADSYLEIGYTGNDLDKLAYTRVTPNNVIISKTINNTEDQLYLASNGIQMKNNGNTVSKWKNGNFAGKTLLVGTFGNDGNMTSGFGFIPRGGSLSFKKLESNELI